jgi:hypothetical protein
LPALLLAACAHVGTARIELPAELAPQVAAPQVFEGLGFGREGRFTLDGQPVVFRRGADSLSLGSLATLDRATLQATLGSAPAEVTLDCSARRAELSPGIVVLDLRPLALQCRYEGAHRASLELRDTRAAAGTRVERQGRFDDGAVVLELRSVHRLQGSPLLTPSPAGYLLLREGRAVAALDLNDTRPRLWRGAGDSAQQRAVTLASVALGLLWLPAP